MKGSSVGDYTFPHPSPPKILTSSMSSRELTGTTNGYSKLKVSRSYSGSPSVRRRGSAPIRTLFTTKENEEERETEGGRTGEAGEEGRVVRVAFSNSDHCNYKSLKVSKYL